MLDPDIAAHYELGYERSRLFVGNQPRLEYIRTFELLTRLLPDPPARVLDVGGGTGVYAVPLVERGYEVRVVEPVQAHVDEVRLRARELNLIGLSAVVGDARALSDVEGRYDAVLLLGPLYHLVDKTDRVRALGEAVRVARPGAVVIAVGISRFASLMDGLKRRTLGDPLLRSIVERDLKDGQHRNPDVLGRPEFFTTAYFHLPQELEEEAATAGLRDRRMFAIEGPPWIVEDATDLENQLFAARAVESEPSLLAATSHFMVTGIVVDGDHA